jgi:small-conductance mechanosensitive channel
MIEPKGSLMSWLTTEGPWRDWLIAIIIFLAAFAALKILKIFLLSRLKKLSEKTSTDIDDTLISILDGVSGPFYLVAAIYLAGLWAPLPELISRLLFVVFLVFLAYEVVRALQKVTDYVVCRYLDSHAGEDGEEVGCDKNESVIKAATSIIKALLWILAALVVMGNLGINVTSLVAGIGIGGIAIALALQNILSDVFSSFSIYADKPFEVGDFIVIGTDKGVVEHIGIKSTRIRTPQGEQLIVSNKELTSARIQNFQKMEKRRVVMAIGVTYGTSEEKLANIPAMIKRIIDDEDKAEYDRCHFFNFGDSSLDYEIVFYVDSADYGVHMDVRQRINLAIYRSFVAEGIEFAFPSQTVYLEKTE